MGNAAHHFNSMHEKGETGNNNRCVIENGPCTGMVEAFINASQDYDYRYRSKPAY